MTTRVEDGVVQVLRTALKKIEEERATLDRLAAEKRREFDEYVEGQHTALDRRSEALGNALASMTQEYVSLAADEDEKSPRLAISDDNLNKIREYIAANDGRARQQDVVNDTGLNSGVVSVGLRRLAALGEIHRDGKARGSQVWSTHPPVITDEKEIVSVRPGIGVETASRV